MKKKWWGTSDVPHPVSWKPSQYWPCKLWSLAINRGKSSHIRLCSLVYFWSGRLLYHNINYRSLLPNMQLSATTTVFLDGRPTCVCVCVCVRARVCVCVCVFTQWAAARRYSFPKNREKEKEGERTDRENERRKEKMRTELQRCCAPMVEGSQTEAPSSHIILSWLWILCVVKDCSL